MIFIIAFAQILRLYNPQHFQLRPPFCRMYIEQFSEDESKLGLDAQEALKPIIDLALETSRLKEFTGRDKPTVIT